MRRATNQRGQTLLEYTVVILTVLTVIFGVFETARFVLTYTTLAEAARAGARWAIVHGADCRGGCAPSDGTATVQNAAAAGGITLPPGAVVISYPYHPPGAPNTPVPGTLMTITVSYTFVPVTPLVSLNIPLTVTTQSMITY